MSYVVSSSPNAPHPPFPLHPLISSLLCHDHPTYSKRIVADHSLCFSRHPGIGKYNACPDVVFFSTPPYHGTLTRYHLHPANWLHRLPDTVTFEEGALLEPLVVALAGLERSGLKLGDPLLICGAGPIGLVSLLSAHAAGATPIILTDLSAPRLEFAKKLVPSVRTLVVERSWTAKETAEKVRLLAGGEKVNCAIECTGVESSVQTAIFVRPCFSSQYRMR